MGASAAWIQLVQSIGDDLRNEQPPVPADVFYIEMHARLTSLWKHQGRHAFLHHLNAIFAYQPLLIGGREVGF